MSNPDVPTQLLPPDYPGLAGWLEQVYAGDVQAARVFCDWLIDQGVGDDDVLDARTLLGPEVLREEFIRARGYFVAPDGAARLLRALGMGSTRAQLARSAVCHNFYREFFPASWALTPRGRMDECRRKEEQRRHQNNTFCDMIDNDGLRKQAADDAGEYIRLKLREDGFARRVIEPTDVGPQDLERLYWTDRPVRIIDTEPENRND